MQLIVSFTNITKLEEVATTKEYLVVQQEDSRSVNRNTKIYNIGTIIAAGYRVNSNGQRSLGSGQQTF